MLLRRLAHVLVSMGVALGGCNFVPAGTSDGTDAADAPPIDAVDGLDGPGIDAVDAVDAPPPIDACVPDPLGERCNGTDDDCDLQIDETFPTLGDACDGADGDVCIEGGVVCSNDGTGVTCDDLTPTNSEVCNGINDDCDAATDEDFPTLGQSCDGADGDACLEGLVECDPATGATRCSDLTPTSSEVCNGVNDDCDAATDEDFPTLGQSCDGADGDACLEGLVECDPGTGLTRCSDLTPTITETCNTMDDDCDLSTDEDFDLTTDPANCGLCGRQCTNSFGSTTCGASTCMPTCTAGSNDCDGNVNNGCEPRNTDPACAGATVLGTVRGDAGTDMLTRTGYGEAFLRVTVSETVTGGSPLEAQIVLTSATNTNFDLFVTCATCGGNLVSSSTAGVDTVNVGRNDVIMGTGDTYDILIEVRWANSTACGDWSLVVTGNVPTTNRSCN